MDLAIVPPLRRSLRAEKAPDPLRDRLAELIETSALDLLDPERLAARAEDLRLKHRDRVHHIGLVVNALVLSTLQRSSDTDGRLLDARRTYEAIGGARSAKNSFRNNVHQAVPLMRDALRRRLDRMRTASRDVALRGRLKAFSDVIIPDGCAFKVASALSNLYPGTSQPAELKLHAVYCVRAGGATSVTMAKGSEHDSDGFWPTTWEKNALYLWDLGFVSNERFSDAVQSGAHVVQRLKEGMNPVVLASYGPQGTRRELLDETGQRLRLQEACAFGHVHRQPVLDLDVEITDPTRRLVSVRVVCVPFGGQDRYYLTTLPRAIFSPHDVAELYRIRWEVELFFRGWRGALRLDEVRRLQHPLSLEALVLASLLAAVLAQQITTGLEHLAAAEAAQQAAFPPERRSSAPPAVRTFFAVALPLARAFPRLVDLVAGAQQSDRARVRRAALALADAVLDGARDRGKGPFTRTVIDQQRRSESLHRTRPRRRGRTSQATAAKRREKAPR